MEIEAHVLWMRNAIHEYAFVHMYLLIHMYAYIEFSLIFLSHHVQVPQNISIISNYCVRRKEKNPNEIYTDSRNSYEGSVPISCLLHKNVQIFSHIL